MTPDGNELVNPSAFKEERYNDLPVLVNQELNTTAPHLQERVVNWLADGQVFYEPGESLDDLRKLVEKVGPIERIVTVVGSDWPRLWGEFGVKKVVGVDINIAQIEEYAHRITTASAKDAFNKHASREWPLILDDLASPNEQWAHEYLPQSSVFLSNMCEYQSEADFYESLLRLTKYMTPGTHIIMSSTTSNYKSSETSIPKRVEHWVKQLESDLGSSVELRTNQNGLGLPKAEGNGLLDSFYVITI